MPEIDHRRKGSKTEGFLTDPRGRPLRDLRISVTDRCNFRCRYCMPREVFGEDFGFLPRSKILTYEEVARLTEILHGLGVVKVRLTGGEPMVRRDLPELVRLISDLPGIELALTTNGSLLEEGASDLAQAGLHRVTVSLDSLDDATFRQMSDIDVPVETVLRGIDAARAAGLTPVKVNVVVQRGVNDRSLVRLAHHFRGTGVILRFIEYMDVGNSNGWDREDVVTGAEIVESIHAELPLEPLDADYRGEVAQRWRYVDGSGEIGVITSVSRPFCGDCTRARLAADGTLFTCLFASSGLDLLGPLRRGDSDEDLRELIVHRWRSREDRYSEIRAEADAPSKKIEMSYIGG